jgi:hypothetical protein
VRHDLEDSCRSDENIHHFRNCRHVAEETGHDIHLEETDQEPVQAARYEQQERCHVKLFHRKIFG